MFQMSKHWWCLLELMLSISSSSSSSSIFSYQLYHLYLTLENRKYILLYIQKKNSSQNPCNYTKDPYGGHGPPVEKHWSRVPKSNFLWWHSKDLCFQRFCLSSPSWQRLIQQHHKPRAQVAWGATSVLWSSVHFRDVLDKNIFFVVSFKCLKDSFFNELILHLFTPTGGPEV